MPFHQVNLEIKQDSYRMVSIFGNKLVFENIVFYDIINEKEFKNSESSTFYKIELVI